MEFRRRRVLGAAAINGVSQRRQSPLEPELRGDLVNEKSRRRPTLPGGLPPSTIGAGGLNCRVRNGNGCFPAAMATGNLALGGRRIRSFYRNRRRTWLRISQPLSVPKRARAWYVPKPSAD